jgi:hemerythrin
MEQFEWTIEMSVGIKEIDDQHKKFISLINKTQVLYEKKAKKEVLQRQLDDILEYARIHFSTEEKYFDKYKYPLSNEHKIKHLELLAKAIAGYDKFEKEGPIVLPKIMEFLKEWLEKHLAKYDHKYAVYFKENELV